MDREKKSLIHRMHLYALIILFFACVVFIYYTKLFSETRNNIINNGRINAIESATQIDKRMTSSMDALELAAYTVDNMIRDGKTQEEILDYLTNETVAVGNTLIADTTGIYGYIKGVYLDGSGWVPEEGYDPTARPWYVKAKEGNGELVIVDPYVDMDTGKIMIALVKTLCDSESVIGIDISMDDLQAIVEEHVTGNGAFAEFILNAKGVIISHSNPQMIGRDLSTGEDPLSKAVSERSHSSENSNFYLEYDHHSYMVYVMPLENGWTCTSVIDATEEFNRLRTPLLVTILIAVVMIAAFMFFIYQSEKRSIEVRRSELKTEKALASSEAKTSFLSNMSHEIRTPITAILGFNEMILRESDDDQILSYAENIENSGHTLLGLINDVLDFSKIEAGKIEIIPVDYAISSLVSDLVSLVRVRAEEKGLALNFDFDPGMPRILNGDEVRVKQIIMNILTNAVKYTEKGSVTFRVTYEKDETEENTVILRVSVRDTGIGIRKEDQARLFTMFERIDEERNRNIEGTGLGMTITGQLLAMMGSYLEVDSEYGSGSDFHFALKQQVVRWEELGDYEASYLEALDRKKKYKEKFRAPEARILMVDDNRMNLMVFANLLKKTEMKVDTAISGDEGLKLCEKNRYDLIFLDHMMPEKDGIETLHELRTKDDGLNRDTAAICLTANAISGARELYLSEGFDDYLTKPIDSDRLEEQLLNFLPKEKIQKTKEEATESTGTEEGRILELLRSQAGLDVELGLKNNGGKSGYLETLRVYADSSDVCTEEIRRYYTAGDLKNATIKIHAMKSMCRIIGAGELGALAQRLEQAGNEEDTGCLDRELDALLTDCKNLGDRIRPLLPEEETDDAVLAPIGEEKLKNCCAQILMLAEEYDSDGIEKELDGLKGYRLPEEAGEMIKKIRHAVDNFDYDAIRELLK